MRINSKGRVTIPLRRSAGRPIYRAGRKSNWYSSMTLFNFVESSSNPIAAKRFVEHLQASAGDIDMSTAEIIALMRGDDD